MCAAIAGALIADATIAVLYRQSRTGRPFILRTLRQAQFNLAIIVVQRLQVLVDVGGRSHQAKIKRAQHSNIPCAYSRHDKAETGNILLGRYNKRQ